LVPLALRSVFEVHVGQRLDWNESINYGRLCLNVSSSYSAQFTVLSLVFGNHCHYYFSTDPDSLPSHVTIRHQNPPLWGCVHVRLCPS
jgi:hypothetical protein